MHRIAFAGIAIAILTAGTIAADAQSMPQRVRGTIGQVTADAITIHTDDGKEVDKAKEIFKREGATDISYTGEASVKGA